MNPAQYRMAAFPARGGELPFRDAPETADALTRWVDVALYGYILSLREQTRLAEPAPDDLAERGGRALAWMEAGPGGDAEHIRCYNQILSRLRMGGPAREAPFLRLCARSDFDALEIFCLTAAVLCGASAHYADLFALARGAASPTFSDAAQVYFTAPALSAEQMARLSDAARRLAPLLLGEPGGAGSLALAADERLIRLFYGLDALDAGGNSRHGVTLIAPSPAPDALPLNDAALSGMRGGAGIIELTGDPGSGRRTLLGRWAALENRAVVCLDGNRLGGPSADFALRYARRECLLADAALCVINPAREALLPHLDALKDAARGPLFLLSEERVLFPTDGRPALHLTAGLPDTAALYNLWRHFLAGSPLLDSLDIWTLANRYTETPGRIAAVCERLRALGPDATLADAQRFLKEESSFADSRLAASAETSYSWDDLVLKGDSKRTLIQACRQMQDRHTVHDKWGFADRLPYGRGLALLFYGPPGTGKTMAAHVAAKELGLPLMRIDLSQVVDKYIGETEKNIGRIFDRAQKSNVILFFDEADALFGKRGEVKSANDRSANLEVGYLLQRIETYEGMSILATNLLDEIDPAFLRRIRFVIDFPFPDAKARLAIWERVFPKKTPVDPDVDFPFLAEKIEFSGGNIKNVALNAAFLAAADGRDAVSMRDIVRCARQEMVKNGSVFYATSLGPYAQLI